MSETQERTRPARVRNAHKLPGRKTEIRKRAEVLLADGEWHPFEKIMSQLIRLVPPGVAARRAEEMRRSSGGRGDGPPRRVRMRDLDQQIRTGARAIVKDNLRNKRLFEIDPPGQMQDPSLRRVRMVIPEEEPLVHEDFTSMQLQVLQMTAAGLSALDISRRLGLRAESNRVNGARGVMWPLMRKFETSNMAATVFRARATGILPPAPPLDDVETLLVETMTKFKANNGQYLAEKMDVDFNVLDQARRRLYGRYGVNTMVELREKIAEELASPAEKRALLRKRAAALYGNATGVRAVAAAMGMSYGATYELLNEAGVLRKKLTAEMENPPT